MPKENAAARSAGRFALEAVLPVAPEGVADFSLAELFANPVGPRGLEYTERARQLDGKVVRITGHIVRPEESAVHSVLLSPNPQTSHEQEDGLCDDLPMSCVHVVLPKGATLSLANYSSLIALTGTLRLVSQEEADGRRSVARLELSSQSSADSFVVTNFVRKPLLASLAESKATRLATGPTNSLPKPTSTTKQP